MQEIEIKARLTDKKGITEKLKSLGYVFEKEITQEDVVYAKNVSSLKEFRANGTYLRIRVKNGKKIFFTLKKDLENSLDKLEYEVEISSKEEMENALFLMDYKEAVRVNKKRTITHYNGCEICIDEVEGLGDFIEMEKLTEKDDSTKVQEELFKFFESIGIKREDRIFFGYDILMLEKMGK